MNGTAKQEGSVCLSWAAKDPTGTLSPWSFERRAVGPNDVKIKISYCGVCHSDIHQARSEWGPSNYPMVPGHEIVGFVTEVGPEVTEFKVGDRAAVGCMVNSCRSCHECKSNTEQHCSKVIFTYNSIDHDGTATQGGYSSAVVVDEGFVLHFPESIPMDAGSPLLCAGITVYSPMKYYGLDKPGMHVGVVGLGGLGHMAVRFWKAFGCHVTVISRSESKRDEALHRLGADNFIVSTNEEEMHTHAGTLDGIIDTVSAPHDLGVTLAFLKVNGKYVLVGAPTEPYSVNAFQLLFRRNMIAGSLIGSIKETQEMLDFCAEKKIVCDIEKIPIDYINTAYERMMKSDVRYRFVIDIENSLKES